MFREPKESKEARQMERPGRAEEQETASDRGRASQPGHGLNKRISK